MASIRIIRLGEYTFVAAHIVCWSFHAESRRTRIWTTGNSAPFEIDGDKCDLLDELDDLDDE